MAVDAAKRSMNRSEKLITVITLNDNLLPRFQRGDGAASAFS
jgi:hypothetical protein